MLFTVYTAYSIFYRNTGTFFIVYLFWFDELIRSVSLLVQLKVAKKQLIIPPEDYRKGKSNVKARLFFLFVYSIFIVVVFGIFGHLNKGSYEQLAQNLRIIIFNDAIFNLCLCIAIVREIILIRSSAGNASLQPALLNPMTGHLITLHLSIIIGGLIWAVTDNNLAGHGPWGISKNFLLVLPFLIIKFIVDMYNALKSNDHRPQQINAH
ncbi:MAG: hypothetical protein EOO89_01350 [Pedobacter sp.]|nr:MAG: hypothetical protein EOO89_01350 [Pedobacter sp.]